MVIRYLVMIKSYLNSSVAQMSICTSHVHEHETAIQSVNIFGGDYSVIQSTQNFEYA